MPKKMDHSYLEPKNAVTAFRSAKKLGHRYLDCENARSQLFILSAKNGTGICRQKILDHSYLEQYIMDNSYLEPGNTGS